MDNRIVAREMVYNDLRSKIESDQKPADKIEGSQEPARTESFRWQMLADMIDIFEIRGLLEGFAARSLCPRITDGQLDELEKICRDIDEQRSRNNPVTVHNIDMAFHEFIVNNCGNSRIGAITKALKTQSESYLFAYEVTGGTLFSTRKRKYGHEQIINALRKRNPDECEKICIMHLKETVDGLFAVLSKDQVAVAPQ